MTLGHRGCELPLRRRQGLGAPDHPLGPAVVGEDGSATLPGLEEVVSGTPSEKGLSANRKWGVKDHIERGSGADAGEVDVETSIDWEESYLVEKAAIERLTRAAPAGTPPP